ncbi:MAG: hypothetical protein QGI45_08750, partial [Myxococcota bacterium]|nr:hypothetical protein [Myxococcota bacterium]
DGDGIAECPCKYPDRCTIDEFKVCCLVESICQGPIVNSEVACVEDRDCDKDCGDETCQNEIIIIEEFSPGTDSQEIRACVGICEVNPTQGYCVPDSYEEICVETQPFYKVTFDLFRPRHEENSYDLVARYESDKQPDRSQPLGTFRACEAGDEDLHHVRGYSCDGADYVDLCCDGPAGHCGGADVNSCKSDKKKCEGENKGNFNFVS